MRLQVRCCMSLICDNLGVGTGSLSPCCMCAICGYKSAARYGAMTQSLLHRHKG